MRRAEEAAVRVGSLGIAGSERGAAHTLEFLRVDSMGEEGDVVGVLRDEGSLG